MDGIETPLVNGLQRAILHRSHPSATEPSVFLQARRCSGSKRGKSNGRTAAMTFENDIWVPRSRRARARVHGPGAVER